MEQTTIHIKGMTCEHCVKAVTHALESVPGIQHVTVSLEDGTASLVRHLDRVTLERIREAVGEEGYQVAP